MSTTTDVGKEKMDERKKKEGGYYTDWRLTWQIPEEEQQEDEVTAFLTECEEKGVSVPDKISWVEECVSTEQKIKNFLADISPALARGETYRGKWYTHFEDMRELSRAHPNVLFSLYAEGEFAWDVSYKYFKGGKFQEAQVQFSFEECKL